jgi:hypothetical protein
MCSQFLITFYPFSQALQGIVVSGRRFKGKLHQNKALKRGLGAEKIGFSRWLFPRSTDHDWPIACIVSLLESQVFVVFYPSVLTVLTAGVTMSSAIRKIYQVVEVRF